VTSISERLKDKLTNSYLYVADFLVKKKIYKNLGKQVDDYFKYIWSISIGIDENEILNELPPNIVSDIQLFRYKHTLSDSSVFKDAAGNVNLPLARSILRLIHVRCYMVGEAIIQSGDKTNEIYILLDGELKVFNIKGSRIITTLKSGAHFGEISGLLDWATSRTASVVCTSVCRIGVLEVSKFKLLIEAYPEWHKMLLDIAIGRMKEEFHTSDITILRQRYTKVADSYNNNPKKSKKAIERREQILNPLIARLLEESSDGNFALEVIHLGLILYSCCSIPLEVGFNLIDNQFLQAMDGICLCESIIYIIYNFRSIVKQEGKGMKCMELLRFYKDNYMLEDILACSPFKLVFNLLSITEPQFIVTPLRLLRLASLTRIPSLLEKVQTHYRNWSSYINTFRALFFLSMLWHVSSCMWFYVNLMIEKDLDNRWMDYNNLTDVSKLKQYLHAIYFTMNIVSGVAYGDMFPTTDTERVATIIIILMGDALFASAFGLMASLAGSTPKGFAEYLESAKLTSEHLNLEQLHSSLYRRIEQYYAYKWSLVQRLGPTNSTDLYDHLPKNMVERIMYECNKEMIHSVPIFQKSEKTTLIASVATKLKPQFYLPSDYVIYKDDIGEEMYFIVEGVVNVMTPDCRKVVKELGKGSYVGEISLMTEERRMCSVIAKTFCFMYLLSKEDFLSIVEDHPDINEELFREGQIRKRESFDRGSRFRTSFVDEEEKGDLSFRKESVSVKRESVLGKVFGFMQTSESRIQSEDEIRSEWITEGSKSRKISEGMYEEQNTKKARRRPHITKKRMRRYSMLSLRKEVVLSKFTNLKMQWTMDAN
jgi:CRP-like cAMP-binding protein